MPGPKGARHVYEKDSNIFNHLFIIFSSIILQDAYGEKMMKT